jgi:hypothetical protein
MPRFALILLTAITLASFEIGCAPERHMGIPETALMTTEGDGRLAYTTDGAGTLYVEDVRDNRLVYSGEVDGVRQIIVDPERNEVRVDGILVQDKTLTRGHQHKIYFEPGFEIEQSRRRRR